MKLFNFIYLFSSLWFFKLAYGHESKDALPLSKSVFDRFWNMGIWSNLHSLYSRSLRLLPSTTSKGCFFEDPTEEELMRSSKIFDDYTKSALSDSSRIFNQTVVDVYYHSIQPFPFIPIPSNKLIEDQMEVLNLAFAGVGNSLYPNDCNGELITKSNNFPTNITFRLVEITRTFNPLWLFFPFRFSSSFKSSLYRGDCTTLNIYSVFFATGGLGAATYPLNCNADDKMDGVMIDFRTLPGGLLYLSNEYNEGDTLVHEVGHWLGLAHTFAGGCSSINDGIFDTPGQSYSTTGCPIGKDTCVGDEQYDQGVDPIHNYMDYSYDCCLHEFTREQANMMQSFMDYRRRLS